jgi:hypothetical protein
MSKYSIPYTTLLDWKKNVDKYLNLSENKLNKTTLHKGTSIISPEIELKLISFIEYNRKLYNQITICSLVLKIIEYAPERRKKSFKANRQLIYRFLKKNNYTFNSKNQMGNTLGESAFKEASIFLNEVWNMRKVKGYNDEIIGNMDETPIFFNMIPSNTIIYKNNKSILIKTQNQDKCRISVLLTITANGNKLPPYIIFKAKNKGNVENELLKDKNVILNKCFIACDENACSNDIIIKDWYEKIWLRYLFCNNLIISENKGYLILDRTIYHKPDELLNLFNTNNKNVSFIPRGLTRFLNPIDVSINKPFKQALKEKYINFCLNNLQGNIKMTRTQMIQYICDVWYDDNIINKDMIYNSFRETGIGNKLDRSEDNLFNVWPKMKNEIPLIETDLENDNTSQDNNEVLDEEED